MHLHVQSQTSHKPVTRGNAVADVVDRRFGILWENGPVTNQSQTETPSGTLLKGDFRPFVTDVTGIFQLYIGENLLYIIFSSHISHKIKKIIC